MRQLKGKLRQIKRAFTLTLGRLLTDAFFANSEFSEPMGQLPKDDIEKRPKAAYDLRSLYLQRAIEFGRWTRPHGSLLFEISLGKPVIDDKVLQKAIRLAPMFPGMERIIRYSLLRFCHLNGGPIDASLNDVADSTRPDTASGS